MTLTRRTKIFIVLATVLVALVAMGFFAYCRWILPYVIDLRCADNLGTITRNLDIEDFLNTPNGKRFFPDNLKVTLSGDYADYPRDPWICPACGERYIYRPVSPSGDRIEQKTGGGERLVMWCPRECHYGKRMFLFSSLRISLEHDSEVSWYYHKSADELSPEERARENEYRKKKELPPLQ